MTNHPVALAAVAAVVNTVLAVAVDTLVVGQATVTLLAAAVARMWIPQQAVCQ